jgi:hypothetical protein
MRKRFAQAATLSILALVALVVAAEPAAAGGSWLSPVRDRYDPGDTVKLVGYVSAFGSLGTIVDGPFFGYLRRLEDPLQVPNQLQMAPFTPQATDLPLGQLLLKDTGKTGYAAYRASIRFRLPRDLRPGRYGVIYCNATCTKGLSDLIGGVIFVGIDPDAPISRTWPTDEPEISNLARDVVLDGPGVQINAGDVRASSAFRSPRPATGATSGGHGSASWLLPAVLVTVLLGVSGLAAIARAAFRR